jgi:hypothetical protein
MLFYFDGFDLFMLAFTDTMRPAKSNDCDHQQAFESAMIGDVSIFKVKASAL